MTADTEQRTASDRARETFRILFDLKDLSRTGEFWTEDTVNQFLAAGQTVRGRQALTEWFRELLTAVPDWTMQIENTFDDGERQCVVQWRGTGTFTGGSFMGIEPNGRRLEIQGVDVFRFDDDWRNVVEDGERQVVVQWHATATFTGAPFLGIEPTGRRLDIRGCDVIVVDDDFKVVTNTVYYDGAEFARQVGMLPPRDSAADRMTLKAFNARTRVVERIKSRRGGRRA
jgi:predicted ester cyclase